ncbi:MAG: tyrosine--tRNA ligase [Nitrososphaeria archaeon]|nr:tyrosine--tRNA ligase [Nitrosopumilaceae archaeon]NDF28968.1 tyrosine--tRNA ligase [Nitrososphaeria archaeon]NDF47053.1 tyrosine--tRNA ligase [Nitrosopumilaceae archaeon]
MDVTSKVDLIMRPPTEEAVTQEELTNLFQTNSKPRHYIGLEISGFLHLGSLISTGFKINDFIKAGVDCNVFLADWHTLINDKLGGNWETISKVSQYYEKAFKTVCPGVNIIRGSELYDSHKEYWKNFVLFTKHMTLARTMRTMTIMGRSESEDKIDLSKLLYPPMQAVDIHTIDVDIAHAGMDQRKIHMLVREIFPKMKWKVPVAVHHGLLPGLTEPVATDDEAGTKMSKSKPASGVFIHDSDDEIKSKIKKAWCEQGNIKTALLSIARHVLFHELSELTVERPEKFGGNVTYTNYSQLESAFAESKLHPMDLKNLVAENLVKIVGPIRDKLQMDEDTKNAIKNSV